nr:heparinase II/III family protein [uncultured Dyadobacter sp.]
MRFTFFFLFILIAATAFCQQKRNLLTNNFSRKQVSSSISGSQQWITYPAYNNRDAWKRLPVVAKNQSIKKGEQYLNYKWPLTTAQLYLTYSRTGNRAAADDVNREKLNALRILALAELVEGKGRFLDDLINGVFAFCEQTYWGSPAHLYMHGYEGSIANITTLLPEENDPIIDLVTGDTAADLAWIWYFFHEEFDQVSPVIAERLQLELRRKVLEPFYQRNDYWWITGWGEGRVNNWTPWCSYNILTCILLLETDKQKREDGIYKTMEAVDLFINSYPEDGGCSEGPGYWGPASGRLFDYLTLLQKASEGRIDIFSNELIRNMGRYIYRVYVSHGENYVNFADAQARLQHDGGLIYRFGKVIQDADMEGFGAFLLDKRNEGDIRLGGRIGSSLENLFSTDGWRIATRKEPLLYEYYFPNLDVAIARDKEGSDKGFYFAAKGGHNGEQHNHNDVGSFILFYDGNPVLIDAGVGTYTRETFGKERYNIWTMQSNYHNVPLINGVAQQDGRNFTSRNSSFIATKDRVRFSTEISGAYPKEAQVKNWQRAYQLDRGEKFTISDVYQLIENKGETRLHFLTTLYNEQTKPGELLLKGDGFELLMRYNPKSISATVEQKDIDDPKLRNALGKIVYRIVLEVKTGALTGSNRIELIKVK